MNFSKSIILVDDHKIVRDGIKAMLIGEPEFKVIAEAGDSPSFFNLLKSVIPDIVVLDLKMPGESGLDVAEKLKEKSYSMRILILTAEANEAMVRQCIRIGVDGIISKESGREVYLEALHAIANDKTYFGGQFMALLTQLKTETSKAKLSDRELEVLRGFAKGLSYKEIAHQLSLSPRTVETHKKHIQEKLGINTTAELVRYALQEGIIR
jgi:DNA-binding NarL/FixJ family response regulator